MADRFTEIKARVLEEEANRANRYPQHWWAGDLEYAMEAIERLTPTDWCDKHVATAGCPGCIEEEYRRLRAALVEIADPNCIRTSDSFRGIARAALEDKPLHQLTQSERDALNSALDKSVTVVHPGFEESK